MRPAPADIKLFVQQIDAKQAAIEALPNPKVRTPTKTEAKAPARPEPNPRKDESQSAGDSSKAQSAQAHPSVASPGKRKRKGKPAAMKSEYRIEVNTTLSRRDKIESVASALGVSMSTYLLLCEENAVHELVERFTSYLETRTLVAEEKIELLVSQLSAALGNVGNIPK